MHVGRRDVIASLLVGSGALVFALWLAGLGPEGVAGVRLATVIVLALGFAASASAVVPGFAELLHGSKTYAVITSLIGLGALAAGIAALVDGRELMLELLVAATLVLWAMSTVRHASAARQAGTPVVGGPATAG